MREQYLIGDVVRCVDAVDSIGQLREGREYLVEGSTLLSDTLGGVLIYTSYLRLAGVSGSWAQRRFVRVERLEYSRAANDSPWAQYTE